MSEITILLIFDVIILPEHFIGPPLRKRKNTSLPGAQ